MGNRISSNEPGLQVDWLTILGLTEPSDSDWARVRVEQISAVRRFALVRLFLSVFAGAAIYLSLAPTEASFALLGWFAAIIVTAGFVALPQLKEREFPLIAATRGDLHRETSGLVIQAMAWIALPLWFGIGSSPHESLVIWAVVTALMGCVTFALSSVPLGASLFVVLAGGSLSWMMWQLGVPMISLLTIFYTVVMVSACLASGRSYVLQHYAEYALKERNEVVSLLLREYEDSGGDWMWQTDASRCLTHVSPRFATALGVEPGELETKPLLQILAGDNWESGRFPAPLHELGDKLKNRDSFSDLVIPVSIRNETHFWELSASARFDDNGSFMGFRGVGSDVTDQRRSADKINRMAKFDTLTGLPNRLQINEVLAEAMGDADKWRRRCAFMMIDLDRFKAVNDTLGHPIGDRLLTQVSERLRSIMSPNELCGRLGGDEFAVVVREVKDGTSLEAIAQNIIATLSRPYEVDHHTLYIGASIGSAVGPRDGRSAETLIRSADLALYRSKDHGGGTYNAYEPQLHVHAEERRVLEIALRKALERNEFHVHYQPVVSAQSGMIESFEALLRWTNPELGMVSPAKFIPIAEDARLIRPIGEWTLRTACMEAAHWPSTVRIAVNVSAEQLHDPNFVTTVISALSQANLPPQRLELEVTESLFMSEGTAALQV